MSLAKGLSPRPFCCISRSCGKWFIFFLKTYALILLQVKSICSGLQSRREVDLSQFDCQQVQFKADLQTAMTLYVFLVWKTYTLILMRNNKNFNNVAGITDIGVVILVSCELNIGPSNFTNRT